MTIIDTHAHLEQIEDLQAALKRAHDEGVVSVVAMSVDLVSMAKVLDIAKNHQQPRIYPALGVHPGLVNPDNFNDSIRFIRDNINDITAIGETGLDYWYKWVRSDKEARAKQHLFYQAQLKLSAGFNKPIVIHSRGAWRDCLAMAQSEGVKQALFHWYSGPVDMLTKILDEGYYVSTSVSVAYSEQSREAMAHAPLDRILIETDSPVSYKDGEEFFKSEPRHVHLTAKALAQLKGVDLDQLILQVNANAKQFFKLDC